MSINGILFSDDIGLFSTSLTAIKKNAKSKIRSDFKEFVKENINEHTLQGKNIDKLIDKKLNLAENSLYKLTKDVFISSSATTNNKAVTTNSVVKKFKLNASKFLEEATPQEMKILQEYYTKNLADENFIDKWLGSTNNCTDGKDDGKISFLSKVENVVEGCAKTLVGCVKELITDETKIAKLLIGGAITFAITMTPIGAVAVPLIGLYTGGKLIYNGGKKIIENVKYASSATTDAEAKDRWENVGNGAAKVAVGVLVTKTSGKDTCNLFKNGPKQVINNARNIAEMNRARFHKKDIPEIVKEIEKIENDILKDPTNFVDD